MRARQQFLGTCWPVAGWLHRVPTWAKFLSLLAVTIIIMMTRSPYLNAGIMAALLLIGRSGGIPVGQLTLAWRRMWLILAIFLAFHLITGSPYSAAQVVTTMLVCVQAAALLMLTSTVAQLLDLFRALSRPLKYVGVNPEHVALAASLTIRSVSYLADLAGVAEDSARARGLERNVRARTVPVVLGAVKYAQDTGRALDARGLVD